MTYLIPKELHFRLIFANFINALKLLPSLLVAVQSGALKVSAVFETLGLNPYVLGIVAVIGAIAGAAAIFDVLTTSVKEAQESLQEFKKATDELENTKSELESINDKIEEIRDSGPLSITDQVELSKLEIIYIKSEL